MRRWAITITGIIGVLAITQHASRFPSGQLAEEREVLWIQALAATGRLEDARMRADDFRRRFPESMMLPAVATAINPGR